MNFSLPRFSLKHPITVLMFLVSVVGFGVIACYRMPIKFLPEMDFPFIQCFIPYPGATPEQVEREIAQPAEGEFRTIPNLKQITTFSSSEGCRVNMRFESNVNMSTASAEVRDRMERLKLQLPPEVDKLLLARHSTASLPVMAFGIFREGNEAEFIHLVRDVVKPRLSRVPGVADVTVFASMPEPEVLIEFDQERLRRNNIGLYQVLTALQTANVNVSVGELLDGNRRYYVRVHGEMNRPESLAELAITPLGLRLKDVADVGFRTRKMEGHFDIDGKGGAFMLVMKESEANTVDTCRGIERELEAIKADPIFAGTDTLLFFNQADLIEFALDGLIKEGQGGAVMSIIVLFVFLLRFRPTFVCTLAIPTSIIAALGFMYFVGMTLNVVTMVSLIVAVGMLVDDAIVVIENIYRYHQLGMPLPEASERGAGEVGIAVTASTLTILVVFVPVLYMGTGEMAQHMKQFAVPMSASLMASLFVAFTLIPLATAHMKNVGWVERMRERARERREKRTGWRRALQVHPFEWLVKIYGWALDKTITHRFASALAIILLLGLTYLVPYKYVGMQDMPTLDMHEVDVDVELDQNFDLAMADATFERIKASLAEQRDELGLKNMFSHYNATGGTIAIYLKRDEDYPEGATPTYKTKQVRSILGERLPQRVPGVNIKVTMPEGGEGGGRAGMVSVRLGGDDSTTLRHLADELTQRMKQMDNLSDVRVDLERTKEEIQIGVDEPLAAEAGVKPMVIARTVDVALRGNQLWPMKQGGREYPVWAQFREEDRKSRSNLDNVTVFGAGGSLVPLNQLVKYGRAASPTTIQRVDGRNVMLVTARANTEVLSDVHIALTKMIADFPVPNGYTVSLGNEFDDLRDNMANFFVTIIFATLLVYIVMSALFESLLLPMSILTSVPLAFVGVYWGMFFLRTPLDTIGIIGCVLMVGVVVRNGIVIVDHINHLRKTEGMPRHQAIVQAGKDRFRPVVMTALTTILGVLPLAFEANAGSTVSFVSLGRAFISGLTTGTILTLVIVPLFYTLFEDIRDATSSFFRFLRVVGRDDLGAAEPVAVVAEER